MTPLEQLIGDHHWHGIIAILLFDDKTKAHVHPFTADLLVRTRYSASSSNLLLQV